MTTIQINKLEKLTTSDKKSMIYVSGDIVQSNFSLGVQPTSIAYIEEKNNYKQGETITIDSKANPIYVLQIEDKDPWELYGSDHNSGVLWFGMADKIDEVYKKVENVYLNHVETLTLNELTDSYTDISISPIVRWNFNDGYSLVIAYVDVAYHQIPTITDIKSNDVISYEFGAGADDRMAHEFLQPYMAEILKKIKIPGQEIDIEDLGDKDDYPIEVNGKSINSKHNNLLLKLGEHLYCSILKWHETESNGPDYEPGESDVFAKKLSKYNLIKNLESPTIETSAHLTFIYEGSNKEYNIELKENNTNWIVETSYGSIGKKMTTSNQISTPNIQEAQEVYLGLLKDKLAKGYDLIDSSQLKIKIHKP